MSNRRCSLSTLGLWTLTTSAWACSGCQPSVRAIVFGPGFAGTAVLLLLPLLIIAGAGALLYFSDRPKERTHASAD